MSAALIDARVTTILPKLGPGVTAQVARYLVALAAWQTADGLATVSRRQLAGEIGVSERTVARWHADAERLGLVARIDGGWRGKVQTVRLLVTNPFGIRERRAQRAHARGRRKRQEHNRRNALARAAFLAAVKRDGRGAPHNPKGEAGALERPGPSQKQAIAGEPGARHVDLAPNSEARAALVAAARARSRFRP